MDNGRLGPVNTLDISHHAATMAMDRCGCDSLEAARQFIRDEYAAAQLTYASHRYPDQMKVQGPRFALAYHPAAHKIITIFVNGFLQDKS